MGQDGVSLDLYFLYNNVQTCGGEILNLYTTKNCPRCKVLKMKLDNKNIEYNEIQDIEVLISKGIKQAPILEVDGEFMDLAKANTFINSL